MVILVITLDLVNNELYHLVVHVGEYDDFKKGLDGSQELKSIRSDFVDLVVADTREGA